MIIDNPNVVDFPNSKQTKRLDELAEEWPWDENIGKPHGVSGDVGIREPETNDLARYTDKINPDHYRQLPMEAIEITEHFNFCLGNALKYIIRCEHKGDKKADLQKAIWYLQRELARS